MLKTGNGVAIAKTRTNGRQRGTEKTVQTSQQSGKADPNARTVHKILQVTYANHKPKKLVPQPAAGAALDLGIRESH
jgi:hypothetical protein